MEKGSLPSIMDEKQRVLNKIELNLKPRLSYKLLASALVVCLLLILSCSIAKSWTTGILGNSIPYGHDMHLYIHEEAYDHLTEAIEVINAENERGLELLTYSFPEWEYVYEYNGLYSPDALYGTKHGLLYDHMYDAKYDTGEGLTAIIRYYNLLVVALREEDAEVAGFAAAFLGHYLADALSPPHMIDTSKGQRPGGYFLGNLLAHYYSEKSSSSRLRPPSEPIVLDMEFLKLKDTPFSKRVEPYLIDKFLEHRELNTWKIFLEQGWTQEVDTHIFDVLIPESISLTATLWLAAVIEASGDGYIPSMTEFSEELAFKEIIDARFKNHSELTRPFVSLRYHLPHLNSRMSIEIGFPLNSFSGLKFGVNTVGEDMSVDIGYILVAYRDFLLTHSDVGLIYSFRGFGSMDGATSYIGMAFAADIFTNYYISLQLEKPLAVNGNVGGIIRGNLKRENVFADNMFVELGLKRQTISGIPNLTSTMGFGYSFF